MTQGYRPKGLRQSNSQHENGEAEDIKSSDLPRLKLCELSKANRVQSALLNHIVYWINEKENMRVEMVKGVEEIGGKDEEKKEYEKREISEATETERNASMGMGITIRKRTDLKEGKGKE
ncbi:uncharacterized protein MONOS_5903 [Monocercomonoides exilis]|uniref:uncharacterized protein n=1 Tax=Monocercomonoides exilis TaxID=2049356 RepID=UPI00355A6578|nr:hypothetical protein MONOS_5903 [Monocercomonoides exilis]|eukprot:MONOS_5903.1-p1 / transcript=MONOS_5903.1 / gene=MONOS_5903 / organism=Monocercomonoides_exilis_PA203 / gene_product=unspecified product / transcript_product=unspecified product / location=Mono_scaffold00178:22502-23012(-) / protein_length=120 / sequence_SO=supercontig / SO=protein_coding / is_pseudo=false